MGIFENILLALEGLKANKMRALLTMLGIIIGISSVIAISTLGQIMEAYVIDIFDQQGGASNVGFSIRQKEDSARKYLYYEDFITVDMVEDVQERFAEDIDAVALSVDTLSGKIRLRREEKDVTIYGVNDGYIYQAMQELTCGRYITPDDCEKTRNVAVISDKQAEAIFGSQRAAIGKTISVQVDYGRYGSGLLTDFTVIGVYKYKLPAFLSSMMDVDSWNNEVYVPYTTQIRIMGGDESFYYFYIKIKSGTDPDKFCKQVCDYLTIRTTATTTPTRYTRRQRSLRWR